MPTTYTNRVVTILIVLWVAVSAIYPHVPGSLLWLFNPSQPVSTQNALKPGIDMVGGTSLTYEIKQPESGQQQPNLADAVATALKQRVDPQGVRNLIWRPQGNDRLEIQMPLTKESAQSATVREKYADAREAIDATNLRVPAVLDDLSNTTGPDRQAKIKRYAGDSPARLDLLNKIAVLQDKLKSARDAKNYDASATALQDLEPLEKRLADTNLPTTALESALDLGGKDRDAKVAEFKKQAADFPAREKAIDAFVIARDGVAKLGNNLDSSDELKRLLRGSGVLSFHILASDLSSAERQQWTQRLKTNGPRPQAGDDKRWFEVGRPGEATGVQYNGKNYELVYVDPDHSMTNGPGLPKWSVENVREGRDERNGGSTVNMSFDPTGGRLFGALTGRYRAQEGRRYFLAIVLDDKLVSAPSLPDQPIFNNVQISSGTGGFGHAELDYLVTTLSAGSLPAQLTDQPISEVTVGPQLGADNLRAGLLSCVLGLVIVFVFLVFYYYVSGLVAFLAVLMNLVMVLGAMSLINATFTLPGVAGIVLSVAIAVDANVLVFERLREEQARGLGLKNALRNSYDRAFSAILDGQVTTAISSAFLFAFGSEEVKGFGLTLLIGIVTSLFTSLYVTKTFFGLMVDKFGVKDLSSFPRTVPAWNRLLTPNIDWIKLSWAFVTFSVVFITAGLICFGIKLHEGQALDIEFSGGTAVRVALLAPSGGQSPLDRAGVQQLVDDESVKRPDALASPRVVALGGDNLQYEISTPVTDAKAAQQAVIEAIGPRLDIAKPSTFAAVGDDYAEAENKAVFPIESAQTQVEGVSQYLTQAHVGGVAVVLNDLKPALDAKTIKSRILARAEQEKPDQRPEQVDVETYDDNSRAVVIFSDSRYAYDPGRHRQAAGVAGRSRRAGVADHQGRRQQSAATQGRHQLQRPGRRRGQVEHHDGARLLDPRHPGVHLGAVRQLQVRHGHGRGRVARRPVRRRRHRVQPLRRVDRVPGKDAARPPVPHGPDARGRGADGARLFAERHGRDLRPRAREPRQIRPAQPQSGERLNQPDVQPHAADRRHEHGHSAGNVPARRRRNSRLYIRDAAWHYRRHLFVDRRGMPVNSDRQAGRRNRDGPPARRRHGDRRVSKS